MEIVRLSCLKFTLFQAMMNEFYKDASAREVGSLYQLRALVNKRNVIKMSSADYHAVGSCTDVVTTAHVIASAFKAFGMLNFDGPCLEIPKLLVPTNKDYKKKLLDKIVWVLVDAFFLNRLAVAVNMIEVQENNNERPMTNDCMYNYFKILILR